MARYQVEFQIIGRGGWAPLRKDDGKVGVWYSEKAAVLALCKHMQSTGGGIGIRVNKERDPSKGDWQLVVYTGTGKDHTREVYALDLVPLTVTAT